jgi:hypothetical protein
MIRQDHIFYQTCSDLSLGLHLDGHGPHQPRVLFQMFFEIGESDHGAWDRQNPCQRDVRAG